MKTEGEARNKPAMLSDHPVLEFLNTTPMVGGKLQDLLRTDADAIAAGANGVGLSFYHGATLPDPHKLLLGSGGQNRFVRIESVATLARPEVDELIAAAITQAESPLPESGGGKLVIRSISKKQRPRRKD